MIVRLTVLFFAMSHPSAMTQSALTYNQRVFRSIIISRVSSEESERYVNLFRSIFESDIFLEK